MTIRDLYEWGVENDKLDWTLATSCLVSDNIDENEYAFMGLINQIDTSSSEFWTREVARDEADPIKAVWLGCDPTESEIYGAICTEFETDEDF